MIKGVQFGPSNGEDAPIVTYGPRNSGGFPDDQNYNDDASSFSLWGEQIWKCCQIHCTECLSLHTVRSVVDG